MRFDNETFFRSAAPFGHKLAIVPSYSGNEASIGVGNPSGYEFKNCSVILEATSGGITNTTLKTYDMILPHTYDFFKVELEGNNSTNARGLLILECKEPYELATSPGIFIGKLDYRPGENVTIKSMTGYSQVTVRVLDADGNASLDKQVATNDGFLKFTFQIPDNAKLGTWSVRVESSSVIFGQDFRVVG
ncbi:MAG TPA: MG2 domain-containing protein [Nitrososphaera sp.]|nr:MG2 domain-containing protein [Nitrososphaera sp.]